MDVHNVAVRWVGHRQRAELHIIVDCQMPTCDSHRVAEKVRHDLFHAMPALADVIIHVDPCECERCGETHPSEHHSTNAAG
jgi:divalent metal cation (Fe/Co/Zn/Cd) transporter